MHRIPLTDIEREGLKAHGLGRGIGKPSQLADCFRQGVKWGQGQERSRLHAENTALQSGYDAARLEIESLQTRLIHANEQHRLWFARSQELEAPLDAAGAGGAEPLRKYQAKLHQIAEPAREFPAMTPELASILGRMCFQCAVFAQALRAGGRQIKTRAEDEQAAVLHWMLSHYFRHGEEWRTAAANDVQRMQAEAQAKKGAQA